VAPDRGQTGGQTGVRQGSDGGQTPSSKNGTVPEDLETRYARFVRDVPRRTETIDGVPWAWRETGSGSTALVVLPGAIGGAGVFFVLFQELSPLIRVVGIDVPFVADAALTLKQLDALLESRGVEHAVFLGASFSGLLVQAYSRT
jgi:hypothetical protein